MIGSVSLHVFPFNLQIQTGTQAAYQLPHLMTYLEGGGQKKRDFFEGCVVSVHHAVYVMNLASGVLASIIFQIFCYYIIIIIVVDLLYI
jgi:hypothetical protein